MGALRKERKLSVWNNTCHCLCMSSHCPPCVCQIQIYNERNMTELKGNGMSSGYEPLRCAAARNRAVCEPLLAPGPGIFSSDLPHHMKSHSQSINTNSIRQMSPLVRFSTRKSDQLTSSSFEDFCPLRERSCPFCPHALSKNIHLHLSSWET